jgi:2-dehydropantoate 2-reductase
MFGRGVIATQYGWALEQAGHDVDFYVRPGRTATYGPFVDLDILDGRARGRKRRISHRWPLTMREDLDSNHDYELIILSVNHDQLPTAVEFLSSRLGDAALLIFNNIWDDPRDSAARLPAGQVVWGFPGGGGGFAGNTLRGGMLRSLTLGLLDGGPPTAAHTRVHELLTGAGFSVTTVEDFRSWLWFHFILDAGLMVGIRQAGGVEAFVRSPASAKLTLRLIREMLPVLEAKGGVPTLGAKAIRLLPTGPVAFGLRKLLGGGSIYGAVTMDAQVGTQGSAEMMNIYPRDVLAEARRLQVPTPQLAALEPVFR